MKNAIVTDLRYRMALAPLRGLSRAGWQVTGTEFSSVHPELIIGARSKMLSRLEVLPEDEALSAFTRLCSELSRPVVLPVGRRMMDMLYEHPELKEVCDYLLPSPEALGLSDDKLRLTKLAESLGIPTPATWDSTDNVTYPAVVKYRNGELLGLKANERYIVCGSREELDAALKKVRMLDPEPVIQEYLPGHDCGIAVAAGPGGEVCDYIAYESLREHPASGGPTCLCRTVEGGLMAEYAGSLTRAMGYEGLCMLDFRGTPEAPKLLEINPRVWGSANLCCVAGSGLFDSWAKLARGEKVTPTPYEVGAVMKFMPQYPAAYLSALKAGASPVELAKEFLGTFTAPEGLKYSDPGPYRQYIKNLITRRN